MAAPLPTVPCRLDAAQDARWAALVPHRGAIADALERYLADVGLIGGGGGLRRLAERAIPEDYLAELAALARDADLPLDGLLLANLSYDLVSGLTACSAFAVPGPDGPLHARNLDWWTADGRLAARSCLCAFVDRGGTRFTSVGWPGFTGVLSAVVPGRFAITLNAASGAEAAPPALAAPYLLRRVCEDAVDFADAVHRLSATRIGSHCLLLVSGVRNDERLVIERSPTRAWHRPPQDDALVLTNDFRCPDYHAQAGGALGASTCDRYDRCDVLLRRRPPQDLAGCLALLDDPGLRMDITVQQMAFCAATGALTARPAL